MSKECFIQFNENGEPERILTREQYDQYHNLPRVQLCAIYTHDEDVDVQRRWGNASNICQFAAKLIGELGFTIPHPEFYPDEYKKFEKDWAAFIEHAKDHRAIIRLLKELIYSTEKHDGQRGAWKTELKKLGVKV